MVYDARHALAHPEVAGWALGALDPDDMAAFEEHLRSCEQCQAQVAEFTPVAKSLAMAAPAAEPPAGLELKVVAAVQYAAMAESAATSTATAPLAATSSGLAEARRGQVLLTQRGEAGVQLRVVRFRPDAELVGGIGERDARGPRPLPCPSRCVRLESVTSTGECQSIRARTLTGRDQGAQLTSCWGVPHHDTPGAPVQAPDPVALAAYPPTLSRSPKLREPKFGRGAGR